MSETELKRFFCPKCVNARLRRVNRAGFWERAFLSRLGFYPWECVMCRRKTFHHNDGHIRRGERKPDGSSQGGPHIGVPGAGVRS
jgi:hypothetical protein